ncbi:hypothetical protein ACLKA6_003420 [Drosophila palustris]
MTIAVSFSVQRSSPGHGNGRHVEPVTSALRVVVTQPVAFLMAALLDHRREQVEKKKEQRQELELEQKLASPYPLHWDGTLSAC